MTASRFGFGATALLAAALLLAGCDPISWTRFTLNHPLKGEDIAFIVPGQTRLDEVVARLGAPDQIIGTHDGLAANYLYSDSKYFRVNLGWPLGFVSATTFVPHDLVMANTATGADTFQVACDGSGIVKYAAFFRGAAAAKYKVLPFENTKP